VTEHGSPSGSPQWAAPGGPQGGQPGGQHGGQHGSQQGGYHGGQPTGQPGFQPAPPVPQYAGAPANYYAPGQPAVPVPVPPVPAQRPDARGGPVRVEAVPGTEFGVAIASVPPTFSGQATGSLVAGIGSIAVSLAVGCLGLVGGPDGWGVLVSGAFAILAGLMGLAGIGLGLVAVRLIKASRGRFTGRGVAISGVACGGTGVVLTAGGMLLALAALVAV
jgi:hypothetical protein